MEPHQNNSHEPISVGDVSTGGVGDARDETARGAACDDAQGRDFGPYTLRVRLGSGGFGEVWEAVHREAGELVAVKVSWRMKGEAEASHVVREFEAATSLDHPNIVKVRHVGRLGDRVYVVSDLAPGQTLDRWLRRNKPHPLESLRICYQLASILHYAHEAGVIHRDLKPSNITITEDLTPYLLDFGLAQQQSNEAARTVERYKSIRAALRSTDGNHRSNHAHVVGTPAYMSPEQARGEAYLSDRRTDVYSLGVILYEMLTGRRPFRRQGERLLKDVQFRRPRRPRWLRWGIPRAVEKICLHAMAKNPEERYATAKLLAADCESVLEGKPLPKRTDS